MKNWFLALSTLAIANTTFAIATIPGSDPFTNTSGSTLGTFLNSSGDWYTESSTGTPAYITAGNYVEFYGSGTHSATWNAFPSYNQDFTVSLGVSNYYFPLGRDGFADVGIRIFDSDETYFDHISNGIGSYQYYSEEVDEYMPSRDIMTHNGTTSTYTHSNQFVQAATLIFDYDSSLKTFSAGYSYTGGPVTYFDTINIDGGVSNPQANQSLSWGMTDISVFEVSIAMVSNEGPALGSLHTTVDNFSIVPEPSTYALITGLIAFCFIAYCRKK